MKKIKVFLFLITSMCLLYSCSEAFNAINEEGLVNPELRQVQNNYRYTGLDQDRFVTMKSTGLDVHYRIIGKGPIDVVLIPGWTNPIEVFTKQFDYFKDVARCIYIDLPGHGLSEPLGSGDYTMNLMADAIYTVVKKEGLHKFIAVGFSWGPVVLGQFERQYPGMITKLVNIDGGFSPWPKSGTERDLFIAKREGTFTFFTTMNDIAKLGLLQNLIPPATSPPDLIEFGNYFMDFPNERLANMWYQYTSEEVNDPVGWDMPFLCIYTKAVNMDKVNTFFPGATVHIENGSGHVVQWEREAVVNPLLKEFFMDRPGNKY